ncbi:MAG: site-2 protease family protein [Thermogutta sp.]
MDFGLIVTAVSLASVQYVLMVVVGLGLIIFVHELGHFLVAKMCGVRCDKFYLGFDFFGLKLYRFRWGETEYGIGIVPLGGYVKMLGQEDNPARLREELERAKAGRTGPDGPETPDSEGGRAADSEGGQAAHGDSGPASDRPAPNIEALREALYDPRSYLSKSVPQRMAIISAGVIMNLVFAFLAAVTAYFIGVQETPCGVGDLAPGEGAWRSGILPGDRILAINGTPAVRFQDLQYAVSLTRREQPVEMRIERPGIGERNVVIVPDRIRIVPTIGVTNPLLPILNDGLPYFPASAASLAEPPLAAGDRIIAVDGIPVEGYADIHRELTLRWDSPVRLTVRRPAEKPGDEDRVLKASVPAQPVRDIGIRPVWGKILAVRAGSVAEGAGIQPGESVLDIKLPNGETWDRDILRLSDRLQRMATAEGGAEISLVLHRDDAPGQGAAVGDPSDNAVANRRTVTLQLRKAESFADLYTPDSGLEIPQLGLVIALLPKVGAVEPDSPAERAGIRPGDDLLAVRMIPPKPLPNLPGVDELQVRETTLRFDAESGEAKASYAFFWRELQRVLPDTLLEITVRHEGANEPVVIRGLEPRTTSATSWTFPDRGLLFQAETKDLRANGLVQALGWGAAETGAAVTIIYRMLNRMGRGDVSPKALVGPIGLVGAAYRIASQGLGRFLLFLALLSANLAVINFLPIPVLDGGHMVFLLYEGIRGKPPHEGVFVALSYLGLAILLFLMLWVFGLDLGLIAR